MFKGTMILFGMFFSMTVFAQSIEATATQNMLERSCAEVLSGTQKTYLRNEIQKQKDLFYSSDFIASVCPGFKKLNTEEEKMDTALKVMAAYSATEAMCGTGKFKTQQTVYGGYYGLPLDKKFRTSILAETPCDVPELTPAAQAQCAVYLAQVPQAASGSNQLNGLAPADKFKLQGFRNKMRHALKALAPVCYGDNQTTPAKAGSSGTGNSIPVPPGTR